MDLFTVGFGCIVSFGRCRYIMNVEIAERFILFRAERKVVDCMYYLFRLVLHDDFKTWTFDCQEFGFCCDGTMSCMAFIPCV